MHPRSTFSHREWERSLHKTSVASAEASAHRERCENSQTEASKPDRGEQARQRQAIETGASKGDIGEQARQRQANQTEASEPAATTKNKPKTHKQTPPWNGRQAPSTSILPRWKYPAIRREFRGRVPSYHPRVISMCYGKFPVSLTQTGSPRNLEPGLL